MCIYEFSINLPFENIVVENKIMIKNNLCPCPNNTKGLDCALMKMRFCTVTSVVLLANFASTFLQDLLHFGVPGKGMKILLDTTRSDELLYFCVVTEMRLMVSQVYIFTYFPI